jgi:hypothetical protein
MSDHEETSNSAVNSAMDAAVSAARAILDETRRVGSETELRVTLGDDFSLAGLHDAVLQGSGLPLPLVAVYVREELTGAHRNERASSAPQPRQVR